MIVKDELVVNKYYNGMVITSEKGTILKRLDFDKIEDASNLFREMNFEQFPSYLRKADKNSYIRLGSNIITDKHKVEIKMYNIGSGYLFGQSGGSNSYGPYLGGTTLYYGGKSYSVPKGEATIIIDPFEKYVLVNNTRTTMVKACTNTSNQFCIFSTSASGNYKLGGYTNCAVGALFYYMKIWDAEGNLTHHFVPYYDVYYDVYYATIYDVVTRQVFYATGNMGGSVPEYE